MINLYFCQVCNNNNLQLLFCKHYFKRALCTPWIKMTNTEIIKNSLVELLPPTYHKLSTLCFCIAFLRIKDSMINRKLPKSHLQCNFNSCRSIIWEIHPWSPICKKWNLGVKYRSTNYLIQLESRTETVRK